MKPEQQRIAIAEWCGWVTDAGYENSLRDNVFYGSCPSKGIKWKRCPDYLNDLNAMHEAEKLLDEHDKNTRVPIQEANWRSRYGRELIRITDRSNPFDATAAQRAEALLRTIGKWTDDPQAMKGE